MCTIIVKMLRTSFFLLLVYNLSFTQNESIFLHKQFIDGNDTLNYRLLLPKKNLKLGILWV